MYSGESNGKYREANVLFTKSKALCHAVFRTRAGRNDLYNIILTAIS